MHCNTWSVSSLALWWLVAAGGVVVDACQRVRHEQHPTPLKKRESAAPLPAPLTPDEETLVRAISNTALSEWSYYYTHGQHLAGKNQTMAQWTADRWTESGIPSGLVSYNVYLNYPVSQSLRLRNPSSVQRGSVQIIPTYPGDPTTPGYPSKEGVPRTDQFVVTPRIPSLPISYADAIPLLVADGQWKPKRNVVLCSWDAEEYGMVGSTEWVEEYLPWLNATAVSYLNIDIGASGPHPGLAATPELHDVAVETMKKVMWMETNRTMFDVWNEESQGYIDVLGSGSDYTAFVASGIGAVDVGSGNGGSDPVYHYHSNFDSYHWMTTYGDPGFVSHKSMAQYLTLLAYKLADADLIPFNISTYGTEMNDYFADLEKTVNSTSLALDLSPLRDAIDDFAAQASALGALQQQLLLSSDSDPQSSSPFDDDAATAALLASVNQKSRDFQRGFVSQGGLPGREFYKHVVFAPGVDTGYAAATFPGITEALVQARNGTLAAEWVRKTAAAIKVAADIVKP
ncbi:hypothetical protein PG996_007147 [Apiospora saccharicola]|uniref:Uncharacterized protein n=1 Tax=Apiospora saccharicola TaxID=335842 RepID=A0ABR1V9Z9_9PEZI